MPIPSVGDNVTEVVYIAGHMFVGRLRRSDEPGWVLLDRPQGEPDILIREEAVLAIHRAP